MNRRERGLRGTPLRFLCLLVAFAMGGEANAQINERDRLERCANNRARITELQARLRALGPNGWTVEQISRALTGLESLQRQSRLAASLEEDAQLRVVRQMGETAQAFDITCFPFGRACADVYISELERMLRATNEPPPQLPAMRQQLATAQTNLIALGCDRIAGSTGQTGNADGAQWMTGTFDSSFNTLTLSPGGGSYDYYGGQVQVSSIQGNVMEGIWTQTRAGRQCPDGRYYGRFRFAFSATGFSGSFGYCDEEPGTGAWNGTRR